MESQQLATLPTYFSKLPPTVAMALGNMTQDQRDVFDYEYRRQRKNKVAMVLLAIFPFTIFVPIHLFLLKGKTGLGIAHIFTGWWLLWGWFAWIAYWFLTPGWVDEYNHQQANDIIRNIRFASTQSGAPPQPAPPTQLAPPPPPAPEIESMPPTQLAPPTQSTPETES